MNTESHIPISAVSDVAVTRAVLLVVAGGTHASPHTRHEDRGNGVDHKIIAADLAERRGGTAEYSGQGVKS
jgi:hypothetical protein